MKGGGKGGKRHRVSTPIWFCHLHRDILMAHICIILQHCTHTHTQKDLCINFSNGTLIFWKQMQKTQDHAQLITTFPDHLNFFPSLQGSKILEMWLVQIVKRLLNSFLTKTFNTKCLLWLSLNIKTQNLKCTCAPSAHWSQLVCIKQKSRSLLTVSVLQPSERRVKQAPLTPISCKLSAAFSLSLQKSFVPCDSRGCISLLHLQFIAFIAAFIAAFPYCICGTWLLVPLLHRSHLSAVWRSRKESLPAHSKAWNGKNQVSGLAGGPSFAGVSSYLHAELDSPAKN